MLSNIAEIKEFGKSLCLPSKVNSTFAQQVKASTTPNENRLRESNFSKLIYLFSLSVLSVLTVLVTIFQP